MTSHAGVTLLAAVAVIALSCLASSAHSSPLHLSLLALEQELDSLKPQPPPQDVSNQNVVHNPGDHSPPPSHMHDEAPQDVLRNDQDVNEEESSPTRGPPLKDSSDAKQTDVVSPDVVANLSGEPSAATEDVNIPLGNVAEITGELEAGVVSHSPVLKEADQYGKDEEEEREVLNGDSQKLQAQKTNPDEKDGLGHLQERKTPASDAHGTDVEDVGVPGEGNQDSGFQFRDTKEEELRSLQAENKENKEEEEEEEEEKEEEEEEEEEESNSKELSLPEIKDQNQNEAAAHELNSMIQPSWKESYHTDHVYNGYDDNDDDDDDTYDEADYWRKITADDNPHETYPEEPSRESSYPDSVWRLVDVEETPSYDFGDALDQFERGAWHEEVKRGEEEEEEQEDARFRPARVIVLNETLYLNSTEEDQLPKFRPVPMPDKFEDYDVNRDGVISLPELRYVSRATEGARQAFRDADLDGDGWVDQGEFQKAGWWLQVDYAPSPPPTPLQDTPLSTSSSRRGNRVVRTRD